MLRASIASSSFNIHRHRQDTADEALDRNQSKSCSYLVVSHHMCIGSLIWQNDPWRNILCKTKHFTQTILFLWISTSHIFCSSASASCYSCAVYHGFNLMSVLKNREMTTCVRQMLFINQTMPKTNLKGWSSSIFLVNRYTADFFTNKTEVSEWTIKFYVL